VTPLGQVEPLSTHDQMLGGPSGQAYLGCRFPASPDYSTAIMREAMKVGHRLAKEGVIGRFALDFVTVLNERNEWEVYAIEINLRKGGTTHPFLTLQFLTDGGYDAEAGVLERRGASRSVSSDVHSPLYRAFATTCSTSWRGTAALRPVDKGHRAAHGGGVGNRAISDLPPWATRRRAEELCQRPSDSRRRSQTAAAI
jgi:hypothetical protein